MGQMARIMHKYGPFWLLSLINIYVGYFHMLTISSLRADTFTPPQYTFKSQLAHASPIN